MANTGQARSQWLSHSLLLLLLLILVAECQRANKPKAAATRPTSRAPPTRQQSQAADDELTDECPEPNGYFADGYQCDKYYECVNGAITEKLCPDGMVFNDYNIQVEKCDLPFNIDCTTRPELQTPKPSANCPRQNGYFAHDDASICNQFYFCVDGMYNMIVCPDGLVYNERTGICTWPDEAKKKGCSSQGGNKTRSVQQLVEESKIQRAKRYLVTESASAESEEPRKRQEQNKEEEEFELKDEAEIEKVVEEGYGKDYEDGLWGEEYLENNSGTTQSSEMPEDYDSADYEDKRAEEVSGSAADMSGSVEDDVSEEGRSPDYQDSVEPSASVEDPAPFNFGGKFSFGSIFGDRMLLDEDGFPLFENKFSSSDLRSWNKRDTKVTKQPGVFKSIFDDKLSFGNTVLTTTSDTQTALNKTNNSTSRKGHVENSERKKEVFKFTCPAVGEKESQQHPRYADPEDCQFFYVCIDGKTPRRNGCKKGQVFNDVTKNCDWPRNVAECKEWYKGILTDAELEALENPRPKNRTQEYQHAASRRKGANHHRQPVVLDDE